MAGREGRKGLKERSRSGIGEAPAGGSPLPGAFCAIATPGRDNLSHMRR